MFFFRHFVSIYPHCYNIVNNNESYMVVAQEMRMGETEDNQEVQISNYEINSGDLCTWS